jgi:O-antigen biosynthesis protein
MQEGTIALSELNKVQALPAQRLRPLIIAGMHRSGTSLTAAGLQAAGLNVGERLYGGTFGNEFGHFENIDFHDLHQDILRSQGHCPEGWVAITSVPVTPEFADRARIVVEQNALPNAWGWKDPRTTLFLEFWADLLPQATFLFLVRPPWEVVDSLFRRGDAIFKSNPNHALSVWIAYNRAIFDFQNKFQQHCLLVTANAFIKDPDKIIASINDKFSFSLNCSTIPEFHSQAFSTDVSSSHRRAMVHEFFPEAIQLWGELLDSAHFKCELADEGLPTMNFREWAFKDWLDLRAEQLAVKSATKELEHLQLQLQEERLQIQEQQLQLQERELQSRELEQQLQEHEAKREELVTVINELSNSLSWQITKPMRQLSAQLKRYAHRTPGQE